MDENGKKLPLKQYKEEGVPCLTLKKIKELLELEAGLIGDYGKVSEWTEEVIRSVEKVIGVPLAYDDKLSYSLDYFALAREQEEAREEKNAKSRARYARAKLDKVTEEKQETFQQEIIEQIKESPLSITSYPFLRKFGLKFNQISAFVSAYRLKDWGKLPEDIKLGFGDTVDFMKRLFLYGAEDNDNLETEE